jgi:hypothetical protein
MPDDDQTSSSNPVEPAPEDPRRLDALARLWTAARPLGGIVQAVFALDERRATAACIAFALCGGDAVLAIGVMRYGRAGRSKGQR